MNFRNVTTKAIRQHWSSVRYQSHVAILCPGQGSQYIGMFQSKYQTANVRLLLEKGIKGFSDYLIQLGNEGPINELNRTVNCQPAILLSSLISFELQKEQAFTNSQIDFVAGYSLGEISALYVAGCVSFEDILKIVKTRAEVMQRASDLRETGMATVQGISLEQAYEICDDLNKLVCRDESIEVAIDAYPNCVVLGGTAKMLNTVLDRKHYFLKNEELIKITSNSQSGAFHTKYMKPAQEEFNKVLEKTEIGLPRDGLLMYSNVTGKPYCARTDGCSIKELLVRQLCEVVRWSDILADFNKNFNDRKIEYIYEVGPGKQMKSMLSKVNRKIIQSTKSFDFAR